MLGIQDGWLPVQKNYKNHKIKSVTFPLVLSWTGGLTRRGRWSSWPCTTADWQSRGSSEMVDPAALHTPPPLSAATKHIFNHFQCWKTQKWTFYFICCFMSEFLSDNSPAGPERLLQHKVKGSQKAPWDIGLHAALLPPSCSQTVLCHESAHLRDKVKLFNKRPFCYK